MKEYAIKAINLDWLEIYCIEPSPRDANYYLKLGWQVNARPYGTPLYREMFTLLGSNGKPFLEIRRNPYSTKDKGGVFERGACHIRLSNRTLYTYNPIEQLRNFLLKYEYTFKGISRVDVCCDQTQFDDGTNPEDLIAAYMRGEILKNRNSRINVHGTEMANGRTWNSIKWGSENSAISTKIYDKTLELKQQSDKLYIKDCWQREGLCDLQKVTYEYRDRKTGEKSTRAKMICVKAGTGTKEERNIKDCEEVKIWRVEYSIKTEAKKWITLDNKQQLSITLSKFENRTRITLMFLILSNWCLDFVYREQTNTGAQKRKDRCKKIHLYSQRNIEKVYKPHRVTQKEDPTRTLKILYNKLYAIAHDESVNLSDKDKEKCGDVANLLALRHGNFWLPTKTANQDEKLKAIEKAEEESNILIATINTFEGLDWVEDYIKGAMSPSQKKYIDEHKKCFVDYLVKRSQINLTKAQREAERAQKDVDFWKGATMDARLKDILFGIPLTL